MTAPIILRNFALLDTQAGALRAGYQLLVRDGIIARLEKGLVEEAGARVVDLGGRTLMPGLIDCHVHLHSTVLPPAPLFLPSMIHARAIVRMRDLLDWGFTTVRDAGGADYGHKQSVEEGVVPGPRLFVSGRAISQTGGHGDPRSPADQREPCACIHIIAGIGRIADGVPEVRRAVRDEIRLGADQIKLMAGGGVGSMADPLENDQYSTEEIEAVVDEARRARTYVMAHVYTAQGIARCVEAGVRTIEHGSFLDEDAAAAMAKAGAYLSPNLIIYEIIAGDGAKFGWPAVSIEKAKEVLRAGGRALEIAKRAGVKMSFSTDLSKTPAAASDEFMIRARYQSPAEIIYSATVVGAEIVRLPGKIGVVAEGAFADLLAIDGDPLSDIGYLTGQGRHMALIMKGGRIVKDRVTHEPH
jgi:imidazolonepropionase-like amidohydrolase